MVLLLVLCAVVGGALLAHDRWTRDDDPVSVCVEQFEEHEDVALDRPATRTQLEDYCRQLLR